jgi:hypothetical protein
MNSFEY